MLRKIILLGCLGLMTSLAACGTIAGAGTATGAEMSGRLALLTAQLAEARAALGDTSTALGGVTDEAVRLLDQRKVNEQYRRDDILVNLDGEVPLDESSACYKGCEEVVEAVVAAGLARVEHTLWPLASLKGTEEGSGARRARKDKERARGTERGAARKTKGHY